MGGRIHGSFHGFTRLEALLDAEAARRRMIRCVIGAHRRVGPLRGRHAGHLSHAQAKPISNDDVLGMLDLLGFRLES